MRGYQFGELFGIAMILASTAVQLFYLEPLKREIDWRLVAFSIQQTGQIQTKAAFDNRIAVLQAIKAEPELITIAETERGKAIQQFKNADAEVADYLFEKGNVEDYIQWLVVGLFALGTVLTGYGRAMEMRSKDRAD
ncbi:MAG TPA: hypothetical protein PLD46_03560 [Hyphomicrobium sp.]|nr:hypothetical protein [Hyphomicrobium sp.]